ncbi:MULTISPECIES: type IV secretion system protein [Parasutterella]|jgi:trbL/virB6 plasmid conjugal transfer protein|uniref:type IV secretion system protein n=1 Tax=Parasutterella TaxID=577310 RepID=UPI0026728370|nr:type IV secretion system protein [Parasutterella excrementihominis]
MAGTFEAFGNEVRSTMAGFAESVSGEIISSISPIIYTGIMIYFFARAYQITTGRAEGAIPDLITQCVKIVLVAFFGLNAANFVTYVIPAVYGIENLLLNAISHATTGGGISNAWGAADQTWETFMSGFQAIYNIWSNSSWSVWSIGESIATSLFIILLMVLMLVVSIYFMFLAVGYLLLYEIFLVMGLAFGPLFICTLMFTVTRTWFDGWLRAVVCWAFTLVAVAGTLMLINGIFLERVQQVSDFASAAEGGKDYGVLLVNLGVFAVVVLAIATVVKSIPSFAAGLTGGVALQAASVAGMLQSFGRTMAAVTGGAMLGYAGGMYGRTNAQDTDYAKENRDALKSQAQHLLGSGGLTNPGSFAAATAGYAAGAVRQFFTDPDKLRTPTNAGSDGSSGPSGGSASGSSGAPAFSGPANMNQTPQQEKVAAANAAALGAAYGAQPASVAQPTSPSGMTGTTSSMPAQSASPTPASFGATSGTTASAAPGDSGAADPAFDFSADHSQFDQRAQFNTPSPEPSIPQSSAQTSGSSEQVNEAQSRENERIANEILKNRNTEG